MEQKVLVLQYSDGEYDSYSESIVAVFIVPIEVSFEALRQEYNALQGMIRKARRKGDKSLNYKTFEKWLVEDKHLKQISYEELIIN